MNHVLKVIIGFTFMIAIGVMALYFFDQQAISAKSGPVKPVNSGAGCASSGSC